MTRTLPLFSAAVAAFAALAAVACAPAMALTAQECSTKYNAAKAAGTLGEMKWNDFRKAQCGDGATVDAKPADVKAATTTAGGAVFPKAISPKYATESAGKARMHSCRDQYKANKVTNGNGGMKWIQKGGGYYSLCNKSLKS